MPLRKIVAAAATAAAIGALAVPASAAGKPFHAPESITARKLTAPTTVALAYRCKPGVERSLNIGLTAPGTDFNMWVEGPQVVCNNRWQQFTGVLTESQFGLDRKPTPGERVTVWLSLYSGHRDMPVARETRTLTAN